MKRIHTTANGMNDVTSQSQNMCKYWMFHFAMYVRKKNRQKQSEEKYTYVEWKYTTKSTNRLRALFMRVCVHDATLLYTSCAVCMSLLILTVEIVVHLFNLNSNNYDDDLLVQIVHNFHFHHFVAWISMESDRMIKKIDVINVFSCV